MRELDTPAEVALATDDLLVRWAAQALTPGYPHERGGAWRLDDAVAVYAPDLNREDRLVVTGSTGPATELVTSLLPALASAELRPLAEPEVVRSIARRSGWTILGTFGWMELCTAEPIETARVEWLPDHERTAVATLLNVANPGSFLFPDDPGARRWAGLRDGRGNLLSVAADAWSTPGVGFIGGVATHPDHRGQGHSRAVCGFVTEQLRTDFGRVALMVDEDNASAIKVYQWLGYEYRPISVMARSR